MWRRSWLSREVLLFGAFAKVAALYAAALWFGFPGGVAIGAATVLLGAAGVFASGSIYRVGSRPAWNTPYTRSSSPLPRPCWDRSLRAPSASATRGG